MTTWESVSSDPDERARWQAVFGDDLDAAARWSRLFKLDAAAYAHRHGVTLPARKDLIEVLAQAEEEHKTAKGTTATLRGWEDVETRTVLILAHPDLTRSDRDLIINAGLTLDELGTFLAAGPLDRDALAILAALR